MDPSTIASAATALVARRAAAALAGKAGKVGWAGMERLHEVIGDKLAAQAEALAALATLEAAPDDDASRSAVAAAIEQAVRDDRRFAAEMAALVNDALRNQAAGHIVTRVAGDVGKTVVDVEATCTVG